MITKIVFLLDLYFLEFLYIMCYVLFAVKYSLCIINKAKRTGENCLDSETLRKSNFYSVDDKRMYYAYFEIVCTYISGVNFIFEYINLYFMIGFIFLYLSCYRFLVKQCYCLPLFSRLLSLNFKL